LKKDFSRKGAKAKEDRKKTEGFAPLREKFV